MKPTEEQIKEFWEWCGFKPYKGICGYWIPPDNKAADILPELDLNNLFKYAVPKLIKELPLGTLTLECFNGGKWICEFTGYDGAEAEDTNLSLALFWAIWKVINDD
jgi:hypothetical protein